jgi:hypothetical protein
MLVMPNSIWKDTSAGAKIRIASEESKPAKKVR